MLPFYLIMCFIINKKNVDLIKCDRRESEIIYINKIKTSFLHQTGAVVIVL